MSKTSLGNTGESLVISVGGTTRVATDSVLAQAEIMDAVHVQCSEWQAQVNSIRTLNPDGPQKLTTNDPSMTLLWAGVQLGELTHTSADIAANLVTAATRYGEAERVAMHLALENSARLGHRMGQFPLLTLLLVGRPVIGGVLAYQAWNSRFSDQVAEAHTTELITNPATVLLTKLVVSSLDDVGAGALGVPLGVDLFLGDTRMGLVGVSTTALAVLAAARPAGLFRETPVRVARTGSTTVVRPPAGVADLARRIPRAGAGAPQVKIENYGTPGHAAWAVYVGGTTDWNAVATDEPWDLTANVAALAGQNAGSFAAVMQAMQAAGIDRYDPVVIAGHSQGGLVATQVAASGAFSVRAVATFGAPETRVPVPNGVATLTVEHTDDVVTALGGASLVDSEDRIMVRREAYGHRSVPVGETLPAHHLDRYRETAALIDASPEQNLRDFHDTVTGALGSAPGEGQRWRGLREPGRPSAK